MVDFFASTRQSLTNYYNAKITGRDANYQKAQLATAAAEASKDLEAMDTNKDGIVSQDELAAQLSKADNFTGTQYKASLAQAKIAAQKIDTNNNGISEDELMSYLLYEDSTQRVSGDKSNSNVANIDGKVDDFGKFVALRNLNYAGEANTTKTANANLSKIETEMQSFIVQNGLNVKKYNPAGIQAKKDQAAAQKILDDLKPYGIVLNLSATNDTAIINKIKWNVTNAPGGYTVNLSGLQGTASKPIEMSDYLHSNINVKITNSSNVLVKTDVDLAGQKAISFGTGCSNMKMPAADAYTKIQTLASYGISLRVGADRHLSITDPNIINKIQILSSNTNPRTGVTTVTVSGMDPKTPMFISNSLLKVVFK